MNGIIIMVAVLVGIASNFIFGSIWEYVQPVHDQQSKNGTPEPTNPPTRIDPLDNSMVNQTLDPLINLDKENKQITNGTFISCVNTQQNNTIICYQR